MTVSTHTYQAATAGRPLGVRGGTVGMDEAQFPHVRSVLSIAMPDAATLAALDTRVSPPPRVTLAAHSTFEDGRPDRTREFRLTLRDREVRHAEGLVSVTLASEDALLEDVAPLVDDMSLFTRQASLRGVVNYVLDKCIPGRTLAAGPDADVTTYADNTNEVPNPAAAVNTSGWNHSGITFDRRTGSTWFANVAQTGFRLYGLTNRSDTYIDTGIPNAARLAGKQIVVRARVRTGGSITNPTPESTRLAVYFSTNNGASYTRPGTATGPTTANTTGDVMFRVGVPVGVTNMILRAYHGFRSTDIVIWSDFRLSEYTGDPTDTGYFDGLTPNTPGYVYTWEGDAGLSVSNRRAIIDRDPDSMLWRAGQSGIDFLAPLVQAAGLRLVCDEMGTFTLRNEDYSAPGALAIRHAINLVDGTDKVSRDDALWFDAAVTVYRWTDRNGVQQERTDAYALPGYSRVRTFERTTPYPGPGFSEYAVRRAQGRGREVSATAVADWEAAAEQPITVVLDAAPIQTGRTARVEFNLDRDEMTVTTRTTDTPANAIDLLVGTIDQLVGTIDQL
ncbi:hypothetical protein ABC195_09460 [Microbacterium sp. 2P01SA-2]|uniref:hypothetical protein n=1 Tax=unclassified Microbacterium TaxID=2609290 RepID=UPI0039A06CDE